MDWHRLTILGAAFATLMSPIATTREALAQRSLADRCITTISTSYGDRVIISSSPECRGFRQSTPVVRSVIEAAEHEFELFNDSNQNIQLLHLFPSGDPDDVASYGGRRQLAPGRAWSVTLDEGCEYNILVEYADGSQNYYESVNTCAYDGIQIQ
ncbi:MAG: hypothetical protein MUF72_18045 [Elainella sp. Prado103]|jgi:hypothetical protein|nr:hypothetical protein [Elainella sp. Prado103]